MLLCVNLPSTSAGETPLAYACRYGRVEAAAALLDAGALPDCRSKGG